METVYDRLDRPLLEVVRLDTQRAAEWPPGHAPEQTTLARFDDGPSLLGMTAGESGRDLYLYWQAEQRTIRDLTSFVHLLDARNRRVAQADVVPGDGTYWTPAWRPGERVIQHYVPELVEACGDGEPVRVVTGWYEYAADGQRRPRLDAPGDTALAGEMVLPLTSVSAGRVTPGKPSRYPALVIPEPGRIHVGHRCLRAWRPIHDRPRTTGQEQSRETPITLHGLDGARTVLWDRAVCPWCDLA